MTEQDQDKKRPIQAHRDGAIKIAIWQNLDADKRPYYDTTRTRSYQDRDGKWQTTNSMREQDLLKSARLDEMAYASIQKLKEQDRAKYIEQQQSAAQSHNPEHPREH